MVPILAATARVPLMPGLALAVGVIVVALILGIRNETERLRRSGDLSEADARHFRRQDSRRRRVGILLALTGGLMITGLLMRPRTADLARLWGVIWLAVGVVVILTTILAVIDWFAIQAYANRGRRRLVRERLEAIQAERQRLRGDEPPDRITRA